MLKKLRDIAPFIILAYSFLFAVLSYFGFYSSIFKYLGNVLGYSIFTNIVLLSFYLNKKFCNATRVTVYGLISLNIFNILKKAFDINNHVYDIFLILSIVLVLTYHKFKI